MDDKTKTTVPAHLLLRKKAAIEDCSLLYCGRCKSIRDSLMPFGWEHGDGWNDKVAALSYRLEALNVLFYRKYGVRIEAMQVKEKFGTLRFYYEVVVEPTFLTRIVLKAVPRLLEGIRGLIERNVDFDVHYVAISEKTYREEWFEIPKEDYEARKIPDCVENNFGWKFREENGKYFRNVCVCISPKYRIVARRHKFLYFICKFFKRLSFILDFSRFVKPSREQTVIHEFMLDLADRYIRDAEEECYGRCEVCGREIGTDYSPRCVTKGWIRYVCEKCANETNEKYDNAVKSCENGD